MLNSDFMRQQQIRQETRWLTNAIFLGLTGSMLVTIFQENVLIVLIGMFSAIISITLIYFTAQRIKKLIGGL